MEPGKVFRARRMELKMKQTDLAKQTGLTVRAIGKNERGEIKDMRVSSFKKLCIALDLSADDVLFGPEGRPSKETKEK